MTAWRAKILRLTLLASLFVTLSCEQACKAANNIEQFVDNISDGAPCENDLECWGQRCLSPEQGYPGGYCTTFDCDKEGCSGLNSECFRTEIEGQKLTACFELCNFDGSCDRADEGYVCVTLEDTAVCMPPGATNAPAQGSTGSSCSNNLQCNGDNATCLTSFFGGYCSQTECNGSAQCLDGNPCLALNPMGETDEDKRFACLLACESDDDCRFQYSCQEYEGVKVCLEGEASPTRNPDGADDGEPCVANINCKGGTCIRERENEETGEVSFPGGYCTTRDCNASSDCNGDSVCVPRARATTCLVTCASHDDCREGYECVDTPEGKVCDSIVEHVAPDATAESSFDITCQSAKTFSFDIPDGAVGFYVAPFTRGGQKIEPQVLKKPDGSTIDIKDEYAFMAINPDILGSLAPIMFPGSNAPEFKEAFGGGRYEMQVATQASEFCYYTIPQMSAGTQLDINLYFVGVPGIDASQAKSDADVAAVVDVVESIYGKMRVEARVANYFDASEDVASRYAIIRDFNDIYNLVASSEAPGTTAEENLSVNVFLINDFNISEAPGLLGVSTGIPGVAGLHANSGAGLVFSSASLGQDNEQLGQTMAHEIGHFLGLRHTTEHYGLAHDPITDTPECLTPDLAAFCPDSDNFMFAFALGAGQQKVTSGQAFVVRRNPLVK